MQNWIWLVVIVLAVLLVLAAVSSARRRSMAGGETVVTGGSGAGAGFLLGVLFVIALLAILVFGVWQGNWFGVQNATPVQSPAVVSPSSSPSLSTPSPSQ